MKKIVKKILNKMGYTIIPVNAQPVAKPVVKNPLTMEGILARCKERNIQFETIVDVGASNGLWARTCIKEYTQSYYLLIEAQNVHLDGLNQFKNECAKSDYVLAAAGSREGEIYFDMTDPFGGLASDTPSGEKCEVVKVTTIDLEVSRRKLKGPFLVKLDTHGFEVPILEGAMETLKQSNGVIIEVYNYHLTKDSLLFYEMCAYMDKLGFRPLDMGDVLLRLHDNSLWQMDVLFVPKTRHEFEFNGYK